MSTEQEPDLRDIPGTWWQIDKPGQRTFGHLLLSQDGSATLTLESAEERPLIEVITRQTEMDKAYAFHGQDQHGNPFTLLGVTYRAHNSAIAYKRETFNAALVVEGAHYASRDEIMFSEVYLELAQMQEWLEHKSPKITAVDGLQKLTVENVIGGREESPSGEGYLVVRKSRLWPSYDRKGVRFQCGERLSLRFDKPCPFVEVETIVNDLQWFMTLAVGYPVPVTDFHGYLTLAEAGKPTDQLNLKVFTRWPGSDAGSREIYAMNMLFTAAGFPEGLGPALAQWRAYRKKHDAVLSCYFSTVFNRHLYPHHQFLYLAHALELYHKANFDSTRQPAVEFKARVDRILRSAPAAEVDWLRQKIGSANNKSLAERLRELVAARQALLGARIPNIDRFAEQVKDTRHYHTHYNEDLRSNGRVAEGVALYELTDCLRALLEVSFLHDLGLPLSAINKAAECKLSGIELY